MRTWLDVLTCAAFCGLPILAAYFAVESVRLTVPLSLAGCVLYLWFTRWRRGTY
jgi:hypothetical protein